MTFSKGKPSHTIAANREKPCQQMAVSARCGFSSIQMYDEKIVFDTIHIRYIADGLQ